MFVIFNSIEHAKQHVPLFLTSAVSLETAYNIDKFIRIRLIKSH